LALAIGMKVVINPKSMFYMVPQQLPKGVVGEVFRYTEKSAYKWDVKWLDNWDSYGEGDLIIVHEGGFTESLDEWL